MNRPILPETLTRLLDCKPEMPAARLVRELRQDTNYGGAVGAFVMILAAMCIGFILATGGTF